MVRRFAPGETKEKKRSTDGQSGLWTDEKAKAIWGFGGDDEDLKLQHL